MLLQAAAAAAGHQQFPDGALYLVATPIGNLADLSLRAIHVLARVDAIACEDTRHSAVLLQQIGIDKPLIALHQHNEAEAAGTVLQQLAQGKRIAYVSDAGTPAVSDPGALLVAAAQAAGHPTLPIPGASSVSAALSVAGDAHTRGFAFVGFLPPRGSERQAALQALAAASTAQVLFEAPHRIEALADAAGRTRSAAPRHAVPRADQAVRDRRHAGRGDLPGWLGADPNRCRGEFVLVLHAPAARPDADARQRETDRTLQVLLRELPLKQAVALTAELSGAPRNALYQQALALKQQGD